MNPTAIAVGAFQSVRIARVTMWLIGGKGTAKISTRTEYRQGKYRCELGLGIQILISSGESAFCEWVNEDA
ncbi:MAG: hypothetical protein DHS20C16_07710 [Phycisphaerae bacterium]|nr:MAG: hypothetical protein DHS20C16_07710 [Phycisphaerae bacterium]